MSVAASPAVLLFYVGRGRKGVDKPLQGQRYGGICICANVFLFFAGRAQDCIRHNGRKTCADRQAVEYEEEGLGRGKAGLCADGICTQGTKNNAFTPKLVIRHQKNPLSSL